MLTHNDLKDFGTQWLRNRGYYVKREYWDRRIKKRIDLIGIKNGKKTMAIECGNTSYDRILLLQQFYRIVVVINRQKQVIETVRNVNVENKLKEEVKIQKQKLKWLENENQTYQRNLKVILDSLDVWLNKHEIRFGKPVIVRNMVQLARLYPCTDLREHMSLSLRTFGLS